MSLQVWLPLNGNLNNQGLDGSGKFNIVGTFVDKGKISSKAYNCTQQATATFSNLIGVTNYSISYWIYIDSSLTFTNWADMWGVQFIVGNSTTYMRDELRNSAGLRSIHMAKDESVGGNTNTYYGLGNRDDAKDKWAHVVLVKDDTKAYQYVNGSLIGTYNSSNWESSPGKMTGVVYVGQNGCCAYLNDFRIYDHCLSQKEIKELSKGLVLHYKLSGFGEENLFGNGSDFQTSLDGFSNKLNFSITTEDGIKCAHATGALKTSAYIYSKIPFTPQPNEWVTLSAYVKIKNIVRGTTNPMCEFYFSGQTIDGTWRSVNYKEFRVDGVQVPASYIGFDREASFNINDNKWHYVSATMQWQNYTFTSNIPPAIYLRDCTGDMYVHHIKYERGNKATPWIPNSSDAEYTRMEFNGSTEYDCSGYGNDGTKVGTLTINSDAPRYICSTTFDGSQRIASNALSTETKTIKE